MRTTLSRSRRLFWIVPLLVVWAPDPASGQLPSPARDAGEALLEVVRTGDRPLIRAFIEGRFTDAFIDSAPIDEYHVPVFASLGRQVQDLESTRIDLHGPTEATLMLEGPGRRMNLIVRVESDPPHRIEYLGWGDAGPDIKGSTLAELDPELQRLSGQPPFSGVVLVARDGEVLFHEAYGAADHLAGLPNRPGTRFDLGSMNKLFTSTAILGLVQEGRLRLDDALGRHLNGFPQEVSEQVTVRHLLQHRSGFGDYLTHAEFEADPKRFRATSDFLPLARAQALSFEPGTRQAYSNMGFVLLGAIIESVTGRDYHEVIDGVVFAPARMTSAGPAGGRDAARRYEIQHGLIVNIDSYYPDLGTPAGGGFAAATDLHRFVEALLDNRLLDEHHTALLLNRFEPPAEVGALPDRVGFTGEAPGVNAIIEIIFPERLTVVVLSNIDPFSAGAFARRIAGMAR